MTWTVVEDHEKETVLLPMNSAGSIKNEFTGKTLNMIHVRAIIDIDNEQADLKDLITSLQKHVRVDPS